ncbi:uncharacterized protein LOC129975889 isoform X2 [Argiope bruennichi]|uniref:Uncharacterized protein n=2 Tax=Argiope bruennichi TaxID=94029 RepID=A0A8T0EM02_ARGBR|nr:uncharacterized protein LOC129975889 isoform X2 [Argiope bruennichi]KAF8776840.1 hypothetical protein HNY73_013783 [Argiope bruennichi]
MPLVHRLLYALRALADDEPPPSRRSRKTSERHRQAVALVITFRDLFTSSGLNFLLEDLEANRTCRKKMHNSSQQLETPKCELGKAFKISDSEHPLATSESIDFFDDPKTLSRDLTPSGLPSAGSPSKLLVPVSAGSGMRRKETLAIPLSPEDEDKTVNALRKVLKWSPRKQNLATFSVPLPREEEHKAVAVVQNAVNRVKEEQQQKRKFKLFKLKFC